MKNCIWIDFIYAIPIFTGCEIKTNESRLADALVLLEILLQHLNLTLIIDLDDETATTAIAYIVISDFIDGFPI